jgi:hypothetical protein
MKRALIGIVLSLVFVLGVAAPALAAPVAPCEAGSYFVFGEFGSAGGIVIGSGYGASKDLTIGVQLQYFDTGWNLGGFIDYAVKPFVITGDIWWEFSGLSVKAAGLYLLDVKNFNAAIGAGVLLAGGEFDAFIEGSAGVPITKELEIYGILDYYLTDRDLVFEIGARYGF